LNGFPYLGEEFSSAQNVSIGIVLLPVKGAEFAFVDADICVIDIAVNNEAYLFIVM
jgi:hypothetical protein